MNKISYQSDANHGYSMTMLVDMDAGDTAQSKIFQNGGSAQTSVNNDPEFTHFTGVLIC